ncbi:MAG: hypothetical protein KC486_08865, partial [Myxococcales bacterium]|nr:hypothetical protein [Myxococcales bacterium]
MPLPFRLLAITPPQGAIDPSIVDAWAPARRLGLALLLREPAAPIDALEHSIERGRLQALHRRALALGVPLLASLRADAHEVDRVAPRLRDLDLAGAQLRGDPSVDALRYARAALPDAVLGRSCHGPPTTASEAAHALVDYTCVAPIFAPTTAQAGVTKRAIGL